MPYQQFKKKKRNPKSNKYWVGTRTRCIHPFLDWMLETLNFTVEYYILVIVSQSHSLISGWNGILWLNIKLGPQIIHCFVFSSLHYIQFWVLATLSTLYVRLHTWSMQKRNKLITLFITCRWNISFLVFFSRNEPLVASSNNGRIERKWFQTIFMFIHRQNLFHFNWRATSGCCTFYPFSIFLLECKFWVESP